MYGQQPLSFIAVIKSRAVGCSSEREREKMSVGERVSERESECNKKRKRHTHKRLKRDLVLHYLLLLHGPLTMVTECWKGL